MGGRMAATSISIDLIIRVREFYTMAYQEISSNERKQILPDNGITDYAIPSYILSVAAVEAFVNEVFLGFAGSGFLKGTSFDQLSPEEIKEFRERKSLGDKLIKLPALAFDQEVFNSNHQPFQDMNYLIKVRDSFVHYKMATEPEYQGIFSYLVREGVALNSPNNPNRFWAHDLCTFEGIRWAHNTALKIINEIIDVAIKTKRHQILILMGTQTKNFFHQIPDPHKETELWLAWLKFHYTWKKVEKKKAG
jgi:hypothetical protein